MKEDYKTFVDVVAAELSTFEKENDELKALVFVKARYTCIELASCLEISLESQGIRVSYLCGKGSGERIEGKSGKWLLII